MEGLTDATRRQQKITSELMEQCSRATLEVAELLETWPLARKERRNYQLKAQDPEAKDKLEVENTSRTEKAVEEEDLKAAEDQKAKMSPKEDSDLDVGEETARSDVQRDKMELMEVDGPCNSGKTHCPEAFSRSSKG